jgi:hypothetical protein
VALEKKILKEKASFGERRGASPPWRGTQKSNP